MLHGVKAASFLGKKKVAIPSPCFNVWKKNKKKQPLEAENQKITNKRGEMPTTKLERFFKKVSSILPLRYGTLIPRLVGIKPVPNLRTSSGKVAEKKRTYQGKIWKNGIQRMDSWQFVAKKDPPFGYQSIFFLLSLEISQITYRTVLESHIFLHASSSKTPVSPSTFARIQPEVHLEDAV